LAGVKIYIAKAETAYYHRFCSYGNYMSVHTSSLRKTCGFICSLFFVYASSFAGDLVLEKVPPITVAQAPSYPENLARYYYGARVEASHGSAAALLCDDPTVGYALPTGATTLLVSFSKIENVDSISFLNLAAKGSVKIAISSAKLPADSPQWRQVTQQELSSDVIKAKVGPTEAKYIRLTFDVSEQGRIAALGIYSTPSLSAFTMPRARNLSAEEKSQTFSLISCNLADVHARSRVLYVTSGDDIIKASNMIDGQPGSTYTFGAADGTPATVIDLGKPTTLRRIVALYAARHAAVDFYVLQSLPGAQSAQGLQLNDATLAKLTPVGSVLDEGAGRAAVDFPEMTGRYILVKWAPVGQQDAPFSVAEISAFGTTTNLTFAAIGSRINSDGKSVDPKDYGLGKEAKEIPAEAPPAEGPPVGLPQPPPFVFVPLVQPTSE
jgi:hypothetical protein